MRDRIAAPLLVPRLQQPSAAAWRRCKGFPTGGAPTDGTRLEAGNMLKKTLVALSVATVSAGAVALPLAPSRAAGPAVQIAACNPCNPCAAKNPCSPCAAAVKKPVSPCKIGSAHV